jgi:transposase
MNKLSSDRRAAILMLLCEGNSLRAITRITGVSVDTVTKLLVDAGRACQAFHDETVRNVRSKRVQCDEIWSFTYAKQKNVETAKAGPGGRGRHLDVDGAGR